MTFEDLKKEFLVARSMFEKHCVEDVLATIHSCYTAWFDKKFRTGIQFFDSLDPGNTKFYWALAETARYAIFFSYRRNKSSSISLTSTFNGWSTLKPLLQFAMEKQNTIPFLNSPVLIDNQSQHDEALIDMTTSVFYPQYLIEKSSPYVFGRAWLMYNEAPLRLAHRDPAFKLADYQELVQQITHGMGMEKFLLTWFHIFSFSFQHAFMWSGNLSPLVNPVYHDYFYYGDLIKQPTHAFLLEMLSSNPNLIRESMLQETASLRLPCEPGTEPDHEPLLSEIKALFFSRNPLTKFPLIRTTRDYDDCCVAPIPRLLGEWVYNIFYGLLSEEIRKMSTGNRKIAVSMPKLFEEYVGLIADLCTPGGSRWLNEGQIRPCPEQEGGCVVDWAMEFSDYVVMIDAKRANIAYDKIYRGRWSQALERCAYAEYQSTDFWQNVKAGRVQSLAGAVHKKPIALVVTYADFDFKVSRTNLMNYLSEENRNKFSADAWVPVIPLSIDQLERVLTMWSDKDKEWLPNFLAQILKDGWAKVYGVSGFQAKASGPLFEKMNSIISEMSDRLNLSSTH